MKAFILGFIFCFSITSQADTSPEIFKGLWQGKGTYILAGDMTQCSKFELVFNATENTFEFSSGYRLCEKHEENFYQVSMTYKNGLLYFNEEIVGSYDGNVLTATYRLPDGDSFRVWRMMMRKEGNHLMYEESRTMEGEATPLISFAGLLIAQ